MKETKSVSKHFGGHLLSAMSVLEELEERYTLKKMFPISNWST